MLIRTKKLSLRLLAFATVPLFVHHFELRFLTRDSCTTCSPSISYHIIIEPLLCCVHGAALCHSSFLSKDAYEGAKRNTHTAWVMSNLGRDQAAIRIHSYTMGIHGICFMTNCKLRIMYFFRELQLHPIFTTWLLGFDVGSNCMFNLVPRAESINIPSSLA